MTLMMEMKEQRREEREECIPQATLASRHHLMGKMHMTAAEAMNVLEVPANERDMYASQL